MDGSSVQRSGSTSGALGSPARSRLASTSTLPASARPHGHRGQTPPKRSRRKLSRPRFDCQPHRLPTAVIRPEIPMIPASRNRLQKSRLPRVGWPGLFGTCADGSLVAPGLSRHGGLSNGQFICRLRIIFFFRGLDLSLAGHAPPVWPHWSLHRHQPSTANLEFTRFVPLRPGQDSRAHPRAAALRLRLPKPTGFAEIMPGAVRLQSHWPPRSKW